MKATLLFATALLFTATAQAQQNIETQQPALERNATAPSVEAALEAPGEMATLISSQTGSTSLRMYPRTHYRRRNGGLPGRHADYRSAGPEWPLDPAR
jgi:hypothetical protein